MEQFGEWVGGNTTTLAILPNGDLVASSAPHSVDRWNGTFWTDMSTGSFLPLIASFAILPNGDLIAAGMAGRSDEERGWQTVQRWNGSAWEILGNGIDNKFMVRTLTVLPNGDLVAGGDFGKQGDVIASRIARWNGSSWNFYGSGFGSEVGESVPDTVIHAFARLSNGDIVAGGAFNSAGTVEASNIAQWDGSSWATLGTGMNGPVYSLAVLSNGDLVAGGTFTAAGGVTVNNIARWNGSVWSALGDGVGTSISSVKALAVLANGDLIAAGFFLTAGGVSAPALSRWMVTAGPLLAAVWPVASMRWPFPRTAISLREALSLPPEASRRIGLHCGTDNVVSAGSGLISD